MRALLREGEGLGTGPFIRLNWQGLEEEGRASEGLPRVPGETGQPHGQGATDQRCCPWPVPGLFPLPGLRMPLTCP